MINGFYASYQFRYPGECHFEKWPCSHEIQAKTETHRQMREEDSYLQYAG